MLTNADGVRIISKYQRAPAMPLGDAERLVKSMVKVPININQFSALVSFITDFGVHALGRSKLLQYVNAEEPFKAADQLRNWVWRGGRRKAVLVKRRAAEKKLFLRPVLVVERKK